MHEKLALASRHDIFIEMFQGKSISTNLPWSILEYFDLDISRKDHKLLSTSTGTFKDVIHEKLTSILGDELSLN